MRSATDDSLEKMLGNAGSPIMSSNSSTLSPPDGTKQSSPDTREPVHAIACITCSTRKVKCDRQDPSCSNCIRSNIQCEYRAPLPRGPRKRKYPPEDDLHARLERYEELLRGFGIVDPGSTSLDDSKLAIRTTRTPNPGTFRRTIPLPDGKVVLSEHGRPRYIENKLWDSVAEEIPHDQDQEDDLLHDEYATPGSIPSQNSGNNDAALLLGAYALTVPGQIPIDVKQLYPKREQILAAWDIYLANVDPLTKILHGPSFRVKLEEAVANPAAVSRKFDALMFAVCLIAMNTVSNEECERLFFAPKEDVLSQLQDLTSRALVAADILRSDDLEVLQAFTLFMLTMREHLDLRTTWMLTGTAIRIAMGMGLHRGGSFEQHFSPFECEYRRRLWWQVAVLDTRVGELAGFGASPLAVESDAKAPSNYNDEDLYPEIKEMPPERTGATEMLFVTCRTAFREYGRSKGMGPLFMGVAKFDMKLAERERRINEMEQMFEQNILRYCDPLEPLHVMVSAMARTVIHRLRLKAYHPLHNNASSEDFPQREKDVCFSSALKILEYDNYVCGANNLQGFMWHVRAHYQWDALIYVLSDLKRRGHDSKSDKAWKQVEHNFNHHPEFITETRKPLHLAVSNLCLKAWASEEASQAASSPHKQPPPAPKFIEALREKHAKQKTPSPQVNGEPPPPPPINQPDFAEFANASLDPSFFGDGFGMGTMDWSLWNDTLQYPDSSKFFMK